MNTNLIDYKVPTSMDFSAETSTTFVEAVHREGPYGAKGIGETALAPTAAAIGSAISNAVGVQFKSIPIRPDQILATIKSGYYEIVRVTEDNTQSGLQQGPETSVLVYQKVRPEAFPSGLPMSVWSKFYARSG